MILINAPKTEKTKKFKNFGKFINDFFRKKINIDFNKSKFFYGTSYKIEVQENKINELFNTFINKGYLEENIIIIFNDTKYIIQNNKEDKKEELKHNPLKGNPFKR